MLLHLFSFQGLPRRNIAGRSFFLGLLLLFIIGDILTAVLAIQWVNKPFAGFLINEPLKLDYLGLPDWAGTKAGLKFPDQLLKANDREIHSINDLQAVIRSVKIGEPVGYDIKRGKEVIKVVVPTMIFTWEDFLLEYGVLFLIGNIYLFLGMVVFVLKPDTQVSWAFFVASYFHGILQIISFACFSTHHGFNRVLILANSFLPAATFHLALLFPEKAAILKKHPFIQVIPYMIAAFLVIPLEALSFGHPWRNTLLLLLNYFMALAVICFITACANSYWKRSSVLARQRAKVIFSGAILAFPIPALAPLLSFQGGSLGNIPTGLTGIPSLIFPIAVAYAIAKHNLFDVDVYIKRTVGYVLTFALVGLSYFSLLAVIRASIVTSLFGESTEKIYPILFSLVIGLLFNPLSRKIQGGVDRMFFRKKFDYKDAITELSHTLNSVLNLDEIVQQILNAIRKEMFIDPAGLVVCAANSHQKGCRTFFVEDKPDTRKEEIKEVHIPYDDPLLTLLSKEKKLISKYDVQEDPRYAEVREPCRERFLTMGASLALPLIYQEKMVGMLILGYKKSGVFYTREDIDLLTTLADQGAVALENARLSEQMKKEEVTRTNLARYLSPQIVDQIIKQDVRVNLGGDKKVVTVLFSDIRNFTRINETRPPDELVRILNEYFTEMARIIFENKGSLDKYIGDAIVAVFGSLIPLENSARNAVNASIGMMRQLPVLNDRWRKDYGFEMEIGVGISTGEVFLGNVGSPERMEFTVIGDTVNVASRFSGLAKPGQILVTKGTQSMLLWSPEILVKELPAAEVKGKTGKLEVYEIAYL